MVIKWAITNKCNLNCKYCYNSDLRDNSSEITTERAKILIDDFKDNYISNVQFIGGEPLMRKDIADLILYCSNLNISTWITTNGTLFDEYLLEKILSNGLNKLIFSIDGATADINDKIRGVGSFNKTIQALEKSLKLKEKYHTCIGINSVLGKEALSKILDYFSFLDSYPVDEINLGIPDVLGNAANNTSLIGTTEEVISAFELFAANFNLHNIHTNVFIALPPLLCRNFDDTYGTSFYVPRVNYCMGGSSAYFIDADGILYPCNIPTGIRYFRTHTGLNIKKYNLKDNLFSEIYWKRQYLSFFQMARENDTNDKKGFLDSFCHSCYFSKNKICSNSCPLRVSEQRNRTLCESFCNKYHIDFRSRKYEVM